MAFWALIIGIAFVIVVVAFFALASSYSHTDTGMAETDVEQPADKEVHRTDVREPVESNEVRR